MKLTPKYTSSLYCSNYNHNKECKKQIKKDDRVSHKESIVRCREGSTTGKTEAIKD